MREAKIQCEGVGKTFIQKGNTQVHVLRDVSIDVGRNEFVVILGPGQCGKTTLLRMIAGFEKPSVGRVLMDGREIEAPGGKGLYSIVHAVRVAHGAQLTSRSAPTSTTCPERSAAASAQQYIDLGWGSTASRALPASAFSGMKQRVGIAGLLQLPRIMLLDEPFGQLDAQTRLFMEKETERIWMQEKRTVVS